MERNRTVVCETLAEVGLALADPDSQISVARIVLPADGPDSDQMYRDMLTRGVHVLPCAPFHRASPDTGRRFIRLSLARPYETVAAAARTLARWSSPSAPWSGFAAADRAARELVSGRGSVYVHPFDDPAVVAGQGTVAVEMLGQLRHQEDTVRHRDTPAQRQAGPSN